MARFILMLSISNVWIKLSSCMLGPATKTEIRELVGRDKVEEASRDRDEVEEAAQGWDEVEEAADDVEVARSMSRTDLLTELVKYRLRCSSQMMARITSSASRFAVWRASCSWTSMSPET